MASLGDNFNVIWFMHIRVCALHFFLHHEPVLTSFGTLLKMWPQFAPWHYGNILDTDQEGTRSHQGRFAFNYELGFQEGEMGGRADGGVARPKAKFRSTQDAGLVCVCVPRQTDGMANDNYRKHVSSQPRQGWI